MISRFPLIFLVAVAMAEEWQAHSIDREGRGADGVRFADVNGDGLWDVASGWEEAGESRVYLHPGAEQAAKPWPKVVVGRTGPVEDAVFGDLDGDGAVDVVSASENKRLYIHWAPRSGDAYLDAAAWTTEALPAATGRQRWMFSIPVQLDGRHGLDLVAAGKGSAVVWFEAPADARRLAGWTRHEISDQGGWTMGLEAVDMDGDGDKDLLLGIRDQHPGVKWLENPGDSQARRQAWSVHPIGEPESTGFVTAVDLDKDGFLDVIAPRMGKARKLCIFRGRDRRGREWEAIEIELPNPRNKGIAAGDLDLDGRMEVVVSHEFAAISILRHDGEIAEGHWTIETIARGGKFDDVSLYDVDQDGDLDIFTTDERGLQVVWFENPSG
ncbi:FG-GAP repeat domain-containing protein [Haloferula sp. A504]|uniref:FG-GAP repeat domain-containing protein n=1 Tax=Haloferula sp. A504 TaxID=3373601 RepID=UPI0031C45CA0|nr:VCBS repeat-containing protein [Verrucomicrobiaceae bacterium E54]